MGRKKKNVSFDDKNIDEQDDKQIVQSSSSKVVNFKRKPLTEEESFYASKELLYRYPKTISQISDPPIANQVFCCLSFMLTDEPKKTPLGKNIYGYVKIRGCFPSEDVCVSESEKIIKNVDSKFPIRIGLVGNWLPISDDNSFCKDMLDIQTSNDQLQLRDKVMKDKEQERQNIIRELREKEKEVESHDVYDDPESLEFYSMKRVTELRLTEKIEELKENIKKITSKRMEVWKILEDLEKHFNNYEEEWLDVYNKERAKTGIPEYVPSEKQFEDYEKYRENR